MTARWISVLMMGGALLVACGDDFSTGGFPRVQVNVDNSTFDSEEEGAVFFSKAIQLETRKSVEVINPGAQPLTIDSIAWATGDDGARLKNRYMDFDWRGSVDASSFPYELGSDGFDRLEFDIVFSPPLGIPLDDLTSSVLVLTSNAKSQNGNANVKEIRIAFGISTDDAVPRITPTNYTFTNATQAKPETQQFTLYNDPALATGKFTVESVALESPGGEFTLNNPPFNGTEVLEPGNPAYQDVVFSVTYAPSDDSGPDTNRILINTSAGPLTVSLGAATTSGTYSLSYDNPSEFDFTNVSSVESRNVQLTAEGPASMTVKEPRIEPAEARQDYTVVAYKPATTADGIDEEITSWPRGLQVGRGLRFEVTFAPSGTAANGQLIIPVETPQPSEVVIDLFGGEPKSKIVVGPSTGNIFVTGSVLNGDTGTRTVSVFNEGNGPLDIQGVEVKAQFGAAEVYSLASEVPAQMLPPNGLLTIDVNYDLSKMGDPTDTESEILAISYFNDFTGQVEEQAFGLVAADDGGLSAPIANPGTSADYSGAIAGELLSLSGGQSTGGGGTLDASNSYVWYLTGKPAGSSARLNEQGGPTAQFLPDVGGDYEVTLIVYATTAGGDLIYSAPSSVTVTVAP